MSARPKNKGAKQERTGASADADVQGIDSSAHDSQPTPAYGFPAVSSENNSHAQNAGNNWTPKPSSSKAVNATSSGELGSKADEPNYDFLWEATDTKRSAKGTAGATTVVESDTDYLLLPHPDVFNAYPPEVQRKIMEWADRDVRARRDDESLRQDALIRAQAARERMVMAIPVAIILLCIVCATITGLYTRSAVFAVAFLVVAIAVIMAIYFTRKNNLYAQSDLYEDEEENEEE